MKKTTVKKKGSAGKKAAIGAGVAALAVGAYLLLGPDGKKNQKKLKGWMGDMRDEIIEKLEGAKEVTEPLYHNVVDTVAGKYSKLGGMNKKEIAALAKNLKKSWKSAAKAMETKEKKVVKTVKKALKKKPARKTTASKKKALSKN